MFLSYQLHKVKGDQHTDRRTDRLICAKQYAPPSSKGGINICQNKHVLLCCDGTVKPLFFAWPYFRETTILNIYLWYYFRAQWISFIIAPSWGLLIRTLFSLMLLLANLCENIVLMNKFFLQYYSRPFVDFVFWSQFCHSEVAEQLVPHKSLFYPKLYPPKKSVHNRI